MPKQTELSTRRHSVLNAVNERGYASISELAKIINVSESTVRRDLEDLAEGGFIQKIHGGAMRQKSTTFERLHSEKLKIMTDEKSRIADYAVTLVHEGQSIFLDTGSTTLVLAQKLSTMKNLTVITDNLDIAYSVKFDDSTSVILTGGLCKRDFNVVLGPLTEEAIKNFKVDIAFVASDSIEMDGVYNVNFLEVGVKKQLINCGRKTILVSDHTKFGSPALAFICPLSDIDLIITDEGLKPEYQIALKKQNVEYVMV